MKATLVVTLCVATFGSASAVHAVTVYLDPQGGEIAPDQIFATHIRVDTEQCVNAFDIKIAYPRDDLEVAVISRGRSILTLWVEGPVVNQSDGTISFVGGLPGGYCGRVPGDPELTNILATLVFQPADEVVRSEEIALVFDSASSVLLSDGFGTPADADFRDVSYTVGDEPTVDASEWLDILREDDRPPQSFDIELRRDESVFNGRFYIVFSTTDKESGLSHFEVKEEDMDNPGFTRRHGVTARFTEAKSPYVLEDQTLNSIITVRAVDNAGNERISRFVPDESMRMSERSWFRDVVAVPLSYPGVTVTVVLALSVLALFGYFVYRRRFIKNDRGEHESAHNSSDVYDDPDPYNRE